MTPPPLPNNPPDVVDGPRKRRPTERVTNNGDPLVQKKARTTSSTVNLNLKATSTGTTATSTTKKATATSVKTTSFSRRASFEDIAEPAPAPPSQPRNTARILEAADGSDDDHIDAYTGMPELIDVEESDDEDDDEDDDEEDEPEDDDAELGKSSVTSVKHSS